MLLLMVQELAEAVRNSVVGGHIVCLPATEFAFADASAVAAAEATSYRFQQ